MIHIHLSRLVRELGSMDAAVAFVVHALERGLPVHEMVLLFVIEHLVSLGRWDDALFVAKQFSSEEAVRVCLLCGKVEEAAELAGKSEEDEEWMLSAYLRAGKREDAALYAESRGYLAEAAYIYERAGFFNEAAFIYMRAGDQRSAADAYMRAGEFSMAASVWGELASSSADASLREFCAGKMRACLLAEELLAQP